MGQHLRDRPECRDEIRDVLARDDESGAVNRFEHQGSRRSGSMFAIGAIPTFPASDAARSDRMSASGRLHIRLLPVQQRWRGRFSTALVEFASPKRERMEQARLQEFICNRPGRPPAPAGHGHGIKIERTTDSLHYRRPSFPATMACNRSSSSPHEALGPPA